MHAEKNGTTNTDIDQHLFLSTLFHFTYLVTHGNMDPHFFNYKNTKIALVL